MAELSTIARPYAEALFGLIEPRERAKWQIILTTMENLTLSPSFRALVYQPGASHGEITSKFLECLSLSLKRSLEDCKEVKKLIAILARNNRLTAIPEISRQFKSLKDEEDGITDAKINSAFEMTELQTNKLVENLERKFGRKLNPLITVDNSLIGGVRVIVGDEVLDTSISARLKKMRDALAV